MKTEEELMQDFLETTFYADLPDDDVPDDDE